MFAYDNETAAPGLHSTANRLSNGNRKQLTVNIDHVVLLSNEPLEQGRAASTA